MASVDPQVARIVVPRVLNPTSIAGLVEQWAALDFDQYSVVLLRSDSGDFCLGMDPQWLVEHSGEDVERTARAFAGWLRAVRSAPCITVAVVEGPAIGGGVGIAAACDLVIAGTGAYFRLTEGLLGLTPGVILPALLSRLSRQAVAQMVFTTRLYTSTDALKMGLADDVAAPDTLEPTLRYWLDALSRCKKQSVNDLKHLLHLAEQRPESLEEAGIQLLNQRLQNPEVQNRLANLAFFQQL